MQPRKTMRKETKARKAKKANSDSENILFELMISYKPAHDSVECCCAPCKGATLVNYSCGDDK